MPYVTDYEQARFHYPPTYPVSLMAMCGNLQFFHSKFEKAAAKKCATCFDQWQVWLVREQV